MMVQLISMQLEYYDHDNDKVWCQFWNAFKARSLSLGDFHLCPILVVESRKHSSLQKVHTDVNFILILPSSLVVVV